MIQKILCGDKDKIVLSMKYLDMMVRYTRGGVRSIIGGANIHVFVVTDLENNGFQKKLIRQHMNI